MIRLSFFRTPKPKQFEFHNRFYDPIKERQAKVRQQVRRELGKEHESSQGSTIAYSQARRQYRGDDYYRKSSQLASIRLAVVLTVAILVCYIVLKKLGVWEVLF